MKKLKRILALVCALNMLFGNLSLDSFVAVASEVPAAEEQVSYEGDQSAPAQEPVVVEAVPAPQVNDVEADASKQDVPPETEKKAEAPKVEIITNPMDERPTEIMSVGETKSMALNTILTLKVTKAQMIYVSVDAPVEITVEPGETQPEEKGGAVFYAKPGEYELTFSGDESIGTITVEVAEFGSVARKEEKPAKAATSSAAEEQTEDQTPAADSNIEETAQMQNETPAAATQDTAPAVTEVQESGAAVEQQEVPSIEPMEEDDEEPVVTVETLSESEEAQKNENDDDSPVIEEIVDEEKSSETPSENSTYNKEETPQIQENQTEKTTSTDDVNADIQVQETVSETPASADAAPSQETAEEQTEVKEADAEDNTNDAQTQENGDEVNTPEVNTVVEEIVEETKEIKSETEENGAEAEDNAVSSESESEAAVDENNKENDTEDADNKEEKVTEEKAEDGKEPEVSENEEDNSEKTEETEEKNEKTEENEANKEEETEKEEANKGTDTEETEKTEDDEAAVTEGEDAEGEEAEKTEEEKAEGEVTEGEEDQAEGEVAEGEEDQVTEGEEGELAEEEAAEQEEASAEEKVYTFEGIGSQISLKDILAENEIEIEYDREGITWTPEVVTVPAQEGEENAESAQISPISLDDVLNLMTAEAYFKEVKLTVTDVTGEQTFEFTFANPEKKVAEEEAENPEETEETETPEEPAANELIYDFEGIGNQIAVKELLSKFEIEFEFDREGIAWTPELFDAPAQEAEAVEGETDETEQSEQPEQINALTLDEELNLKSETWFDEIKLTVTDISGEQTVEILLINPEKKETEEEKAEPEEVIIEAMSYDFEGIGDQVAVQALLDKYEIQIEFNREGIHWEPELFDAPVKESEETDKEAEAAEEADLSEEDEQTEVPEQINALTLDEELNLRAETWFDEIRLTVTDITGEQSYEFILTNTQEKESEEVKDIILHYEDLDFFGSLDPLALLEAYPDLKEAEEVEPEPIEVPLMKSGLKSAPMPAKKMMKAEKSEMVPAEDGEGESLPETEKESVAIPQQKILYRAFQIDIPEDAVKNEDGLYSLDIVLPEPIDLTTEEEIGKNAVINSIGSFEFYHINKDSENPVELNDTFQPTIEGNQLLGFTFETASASPFVVKYTVDFTYVDEETGEVHTFSLNGQDEWPLEDILTALGIEFEVIENAELELTEIFDEKDVDEEGRDALYLDGDAKIGYVLHSYAAFDDIYKLTIIADGKSYVLTVTDDQTYTIKLVTVGDVILDSSYSVALRAGPNPWDDPLGSKPVDGDTYEFSGIDDWRVAANFVFGIQKDGNFYGNGATIGDYLVSTSTGDENVLTITKPLDFKLVTSFKEYNDTLSTTVPDGYWLLIKMISNGENYYALHEVSGSNPSSASAPITFTKCVPNNQYDPGQGYNLSGMYYYSGAETLTTQVVIFDEGVTPSLDIAVPEMNSAGTGVTRYNENMVGSTTQKRDLTKDLYSSESFVALDVTENVNVMHTTFTRRKDDPVPHKILVNFYEEKGTATLSDNGRTSEAGLKTGEGDYYLTVELRNIVDKEKQDGKTVGYSIISLTNSDLVSANTNGYIEKTIDADQTFQLCDDNGGDIDGGALHYDPSIYVSNITLYQKNEGESFPTTLTQAKANGTRDITGYDFWYNANWLTETGKFGTNETYETLATGTDGNYSETRTRIGLYKSYDKIYKVEVVFEGDAQESGYENYYVRATADHETSGAERYTKELAGGSTGSPFTHVIVDDVEEIQNWTEYQDRNGNWSGTPNQNPISGNEIYTIEIGIVDNNQFTAIKEGYPIKINGEYYEWSTDLHDMNSGKNVVSANGITTITDKLVLKKAAYEEALDPYDVLGDGAEYGIVANSYERWDHTETNFAVNQYTESTAAGIDLAANESADAEGMPFYIGEFNKIHFTANTTVNPDIYTPVDGRENDSPYVHQSSDESTDKIHQDSYNYEVTVFPTSKGSVKNEVDKLIAKLQASSLEYPQKNMIAPEGTNVDTTMFPDEITIYVDATNLRNGQQWTIEKLPGQTIVFNIPGDTVNLVRSKYIVYSDATKQNIDYELDTHSNGNGGNKTDNDNLENYILNHIVFNAYEANSITFENGPEGLFLSHHGQFEEWNGSGTGWVATGNRFEQHGAEWHFFRTQRHYKRKTVEAGFKASKFMNRLDEDGKYIVPNKDQVFTFVMEHLDWENGQWELLSQKHNDGSIIDFEEFEYELPEDEGTHYYRIRELYGGNSNKYEPSSMQYYVAVDVGITNITTSNYDLVPPVYHYYQFDTTSSVDASTFVDTIDQTVHKTTLKTNSNGTTVPFPTTEEEDIPRQGIDFEGNSTYLKSATESTSESASATAIQFINTYVGKYCVGVTKKWDDRNNRDGIRPDGVIVELWKTDYPLDEDGKPDTTKEKVPQLVTGIAQAQNNVYYDENGDEAARIDYAILNDANNWTHIVKGIDKYDSLGEIIEYEWREIGLLYDTTEETTITREADGSYIITKGFLTTKDSDGHYTIYYNAEESPKFVPSSEQGYEALYYTSEVAGIDTKYSPEDDGTITYLTGLTNKHKTVTTTVKATKNWDDENDTDGLRKDVTFRLLATYTVDAVDADGNVIMDESGKVKTKVYEVRNVTDENSIKVSDITIKAKDESGALLTDDDLVATWSDLPKYYNGHEITYYVVEVDTPEGYELAYGEQDADALTEDNNPLAASYEKIGKLTWNSESNAWELTATNKHEVIKTKAEVIKIWDDMNDVNGLRPESIAMTLMVTPVGGTETAVQYNDGTEDKDLIVTLPTAENADITGLQTAYGDYTVAYDYDDEAKAWSATVSRLPTYVDGVKQVYSWAEPDTIDHYTEGVAIVNTITVTEGEGDDAVTYNKTTVSFTNALDTNMLKLYKAFSFDGTPFDLNDLTPAQKENLRFAVTTTFGEGENLKKYYVALDTENTDDPANLHGKWAKLVEYTDVEDIVPFTYKDFSDGMLVLENLPYGTYTITETEVQNENGTSLLLTGYTWTQATTQVNRTGEVATYTKGDTTNPLTNEVKVDEAVVGDGDFTQVFFSNTYETDKISIRAYKKWEGDLSETEPDYDLTELRQDVTFILEGSYQVGEGSDAQTYYIYLPEVSDQKAEQTVAAFTTDTNGDTSLNTTENYAEWTDLPRYYQGNEITYTVKEVVVNGYTSKYSYYDETEAIVKNDGEYDDAELVYNETTEAYELTVTNTLDKGNFDITKSIFVNNENMTESNTDKEFYVKVLYTDAQGNTWYITGSNGAMTKADNPSTALEDAPKFLVQTTTGEGDDAVTELKLSFENVPTGTYTVYEVDAGGKLIVTEDEEGNQVINEPVPIGESSFSADLSRVVATVEVTASGNSTTTETTTPVAELINKYTSGKYCIAVTKQWLVNGEAAEGPDLTVTLTRGTMTGEAGADGKPTFVADENFSKEFTLTKENNWSAVAVGMDEMDANGNRYIYTWTEGTHDGWAEGVQVEVQANETVTSKIYLTKLTNSKVDVEIPVEKTFDSTGDAYNGTETFTVKLTDLMAADGGNLTGLIKKANGTVVTSGDPSVTLKQNETGAFSIEGITAADTYTFTLKEEVPNPPTPGMTYAADQTVTVVVDWYKLVNSAETKTSATDDEKSFLKVTSITIGKDTTDVQDDPTVTVQNKYELGSLKLTKTIAGVDDADKAALDGLRFEVKDSNDKTVAIVYYKDFDQTKTLAELTIPNLPFGAYTVEESRTDVTTPDGYTFVETQIEYDQTADATAAGINATQKTAAAAVTNIYNKHTDYKPQVEKKVVDADGRAYTTEQEFTFTINANTAYKDDPANTFSPIPTPAPDSVTVKGSDTAEFNPITYTEEGTYIYTISEMEPEDAVDHEKDGFTYSQDGVTLTVTVTADVSHNLNAVGVYTKLAPTDDDPDAIATGNTIINTYDAVGETTIEGTKTIVNRNFKEGDTWTFTIEAKDGAPMKDETGAAYDSTDLTVNNDGSIVEFPAFYYTLDDLWTETTDADSGETSGAFAKTKAFTYRVTESGSVNSVDNDPTATRDITVTVTDNGDGTLSVVKSPDNDGESFNFINTYKATGETDFEAQKAFTNGTIADDQFTFSVTRTDENGIALTGEDAYSKTMSTAATTGKAALAPTDKVSYDQDDIGLVEYYTIKETIPAGATEANDYTFDGIRYDPTVWLVRVEVSDTTKDGNLTVTKTYKKLGSEDAFAAWPTDGPTFTNEQLYKLDVTKTVTVTDNFATEEEKNNIINNTIYLVSVSKDGKYYATNGAEVTEKDQWVEIKNGETRNWINLEKGTYTVTENVQNGIANVTGYSRTTKIQVGTAEAVNSNTANNVELTNPETALTVSLTNDYTRTTTKVQVLKVWQDNEGVTMTSGMAPELPVTLKGNGVAVTKVYIGTTETTLTDGKVTLKAEEEWQSPIYTVPAYTAAGDYITYSWTENLPAQPEGWSLKDSVESDLTEPDTSEGAAEGATIVVGKLTTLTNVFKPDLTSVKVLKIWDDADNQDGKRPTSITVELWKTVGTGAEAVTSQVKDESNNNVTKVLNADNNWSDVFTDLPIKESGKTVKYFVKEKDVTDGTGEYVGKTVITFTTGATYVVTYDSNETDTDWTITNSYEPEKTEVPVTKTWDDANDQDGVRPDEITVILYADGVPVAEKVLKTSDAEVTESEDKNSWSYTFKNLPKYAQKTTNSTDEATGETTTTTASAEIIYTVSEFTSIDLTDQYTYEGRTGDATEGFILTNKHTPKTIDVTAKKVWEDNHNQDGKRASVTLVLVGTYTVDGTAKTVTIADAEKTITDLTADEAEVTWSGLPEKQEGQTVTYTVTEKNTVVDGETGKATITLNGAVYEVSIDGYTVTNSYIPEMTDVKIIKKWVDDGHEDKRPGSLIVALMTGENADEAALDENGEPITVTLTANDWTASVGNLPKYKDGEKIVYTWVEEELPEGYILSGSEIEGETTTLTNSYTVPDFDKKTKDTNDSTGVTSGWQDSADYDIGDDVPFQLTAKLPGNVTDYTKYTITFTDTFESGLTFNANSAVVKVNGTEQNVTPVMDGQTVRITLTWEGENGGKITDTSLNYADVTVEYTAKLNENAVAGATGNANEAKLSYSNNPADTSSHDETEGDAAIVFTYSLVFNKLDDGGNAVNGAVFKLEKNLADGTKQEKGLTVNGNVFSVKGLDDGDYILTEEALEGYQGIDPIKFTVTAEHQIVWSERSEMLTSLNGNVTTGELTLEAANDLSALSGDVINEAITEATVVKIWDDGSNKAGQRPATITVKLIKNNDVEHPVKTITLPYTGSDEDVKAVDTGDANKWAATVKNLPVFENGDRIVYSWIEDTDGLAALNYSMSQLKTTETDGKATTEIKNTYDTQKYCLAVMKVWDDANDQDRIRPGEITVRLFKLNKDGEPEEVAFATSVGGKAEKGAVLKAPNWSVIALGVEKYQTGADGKAEEITYYWQEEGTEGYELTTEHVKIKGEDYVTANEATTRLTTLTNKYEPELTERTVTKVWDDEDNQDGLRAESVTIELLANGKPVAETVLNEANKWTHTFEKLAKNANGTPIVYTVREINAPEGYTVTIANEVNEQGETIDNSFVVTNSHVPELIEKQIIKVWDDQDNQNGLCPTELTVNLMANGNLYTTKTLNEGNKWTETAVDLPKYKDGKKITYQWAEVLNNNTPYRKTGEQTIDTVFDKGEGKTVEGTITTITNSLNVGDLTVSKVMTVDDEKIPTDKQFEFTVTDKDGKYADMNGKLTTTKTILTVKAGSNVTIRNLPAGQYTVTEITESAEIVNYTLAATGGGNATVAVGATAESTLNNKYDRKHGNLQVTKKVTGVRDADKAGKTFKVRVKDEDGIFYSQNGTAIPEANAWVEVGADAAATWNNLPWGIYTVEEDTTDEAVSIERYTWNADGSLIAAEGIRVDDTAYAELRNDYTEDTAELTIRKTFSFQGKDDSAQKKDLDGLRFHIAGKDADGATVYDQIVTYSQFTVSGTNDYEGTYTITVPAGTYEITEENAGTLIDHYELVAATSTTNGKTGELKKNGTGTVDLTNEYRRNTAQLMIYKTFSGIPSDADLSKVRFTVTGPNGYSAELSYAEDFPNGVCTLNNLEVGTYTVTEITKDEKDNDLKLIKDYTLNTDNSVTSGTVSVVEATNNQEGAIIKLVNIYDQDLGSLKIRKSFEGVSGKEEEKNNLQFQITGPDGQVIRTVTYAEFTDGEFTITGLPVGEYTVTETNADGLIAGYRLITGTDENASVLSGTATVTKDQTVEVALSNKYVEQLGAIEITKVINGADPTKGFEKLTFKVVGPNDYDKDFFYEDFKEGKLTIPDLPIGTYVVYETNAGKVISTLTLLGTSETAAKATVTEGGTARVKLTNNYEQPTTSVVVMKIWEDMENLDGSRPASITMTLSNGQTVTLSDDNAWMAEITNLPLYDADGNVISYTWSEPAVPGYVMANLNTIANATVFTNNHVPDLTSVSVTKIWDDGNNALGLRPATLKVTLSPTGRSYTLSAANNWTVKVEDLPKFYNGQEIRYTWSEQTVLGYTSEVRVVDNVTVFTNHYRITPPGPPEEPGQPRLPRTPVYVFEDYKTPLGVEVMINHVGDCFD